MANQLDPRIAAMRTTTAEAAAGFDAGLRAHMLSVYNYMASGVLLTGIIALLFAQGETPEASLAGQIFMQPGILKWVVILAPLGLVMWLSMGINRLSEQAAKGIFWAYAALMGASLSTIFLAYTGASIATTFFATAAGFASLSLYGYTTKRDLSGFGKFLLMGLVGIIIASLANLFFQSGALNLAISIVGVLLFAGLTVYDTQKIKNFYFEVRGTDFAGKAVVMGALTLYLDFINLFLFLLRFMGDRR
jgi:FtsH-binding integral membrane protein